MPNLSVHRLMLIVLLSCFLFIWMRFAYPCDSKGPLTVIQQTGTLRIGTTGDYPPLTIYNHKTRQFSGSEVAAAKDLAKFLGLRAKFIKTTWPTLAADLQANRFDIAIGGISSTPQRAHAFLLSAPLYATGKVPLVRCADVNRYTSLQAINQPQVTVVENPGGTNESFAKKNLPHAQFIITATNEAAFTALLTKRADVMMTDTTEAIYRQKKMPGLCAVHPERPFTRDIKIILLPKNSGRLLTKINEWAALKDTKKFFTH